MQRAQYHVPHFRAPYQGPPGAHPVCTNSYPGFIGEISIYFVYLVVSIYLILFIHIIYIYTYIICLYTVINCMYIYIYMICTSIFESPLWLLKFPCLIHDQFGTGSSVALVTSSAAADFTSKNLPRGSTAPSTWRKRGSSRNVLRKEECTDRRSSI
jgi:hypothetical protein